MKKLSILLILSILIFSLCFFGCSDLIDSMAQVELRLQFDDHQIPLVSEFSVRGTKQDSRTTFQKQLGNLKQVTIVPLEPGVWTLQVEAKVEGLVKATGTTTVTAKSGKKTSAIIDLVYQYDVDFNANSGSVPSMAGKDVVYNAAYGTLPVTTKPGYTFLGWFTAANGGIKIEETTIFRETTNQTLFAQWQANTYTAYLDAGQGSGGTTNTTVIYDQPMTSSLIAPNRSGYLFTGYWDSIAGGEQYYSAAMQSNKSYDKTSDSVLYAQWAPLTYVITFDQNGGNIPDSTTKTVSYDAPYGTLAVVSRDGYIFTDWNTKPDGSGSTITGTSQVAILEDQTLYANWIANSYTLFFDSNGGGHIDVASKSVTYDATYGALPLPTRSGYTFRGWFTESDGTGSEIDGNTQVTITSDQNLYAIWNGNSYEITFDANGGSPGTHSCIAVFGSDMPSGLTVPNRPGYAFIGYFDSQIGGIQYISASMQSNKIWDKVEASTLYAHWTEASYTVAFDPNGGTNSGSTSKTVTYDALYDVLPTPTRDGYTFVDWNTKADGTGITITAASIVTTTNDQALYAIWTANSYTAAFSANGGDAVNPTEMTVTYASTYGTLPNASRTGYELSGWNTASDGSGSIITAESIVTEAKNHTLYAQWAFAKSFVELYNGTRFNAVYAVQNQDMPSENTTGFTITAPTKTGYTFTGMFLDGVKYYNTDMTSARLWDKPYSVSGYSLLAGWTVNQYTITLDSKGGSGGTQSITVDYQGTLPRIDLPVKTGYYFEAYYYNKYTDQGDLYYHAKYYGDGGPSNTYLDPNITTWGNDTDATFEATWIPLTSAVSLIRNRTSLDIDSYKTITATYGQQMPSNALSSPPTRTGYVFGGFYDTADCTGKQYYSSTLESTNIWDKVASSANLYAKWIGPSTVTFNSNGGSSVTSIENVAYNTKISAPATDPIKDHQVFVGWYKDVFLQNAWDFEQDVVTENMTLYAKWRNYTFGDVGPAGGVVFIVNYDQSLPWKYMEARLDKKVLITFSPAEADRYSFNLGSDIGTGKANTIAIRECYDARYHDTDYAAYYCDTLSVDHQGDTYSDWFLPSDEEVKDLFDNLLHMPEYRFNDGEIWTSTQDYTYAYLIGTYAFSDDYANRWYWWRGQDESHYAIPVRTF